MNEGVTPWWDNKGQLQYGGGSDPSQRIEYLLTTGKKPWQKKLFENEGRSVDMSSRLNYLRYPLELLNTPSHMSAMVFEIYDTNPTHLNTARTRLGRAAETTISSAIASQTESSFEHRKSVFKIQSSQLDRVGIGSGITPLPTAGEILTAVQDQGISIKDRNGNQLKVIRDGDVYLVATPNDTLKRVTTLSEANIDMTQGSHFGKGGAVDTLMQNLLSTAGGAGGLLADLGEIALWGSENVTLDPSMDKTPSMKMAQTDFTGYKRDSFVEEVTGFKNNTKDVGARIYLYLPNNIETEYGFEYEDTNMSALDIARLAKVVSESGNKDLAAVVGRKLAMSNLKTIEGVAKDLPVLGSVIEDGSLNKFVEAQSRQIVNPMAMHLFKEVKRREFTFTYTFLPKNVNEMLNCYRIIHLFKYYAHPATSGHGRFLDYPAEFNIKFYQKNNSNQDIISGYLPYIFKCALKGIKVTYGEDSVMSTFMPDLAGAPPTKIGLELQFSELEILTRDRFGDNSWMPGINLPQP